jgi:hypothetical protein
MARIAAAQKTSVTSSKDLSASEKFTKLATAILASPRLASEFNITLRKGPKGPTLAGWTSLGVDPARQKANVADVGRLAAKLMPGFKLKIEEPWPDNSTEKLRAAVVKAFPSALRTDVGNPIDVSTSDKSVVMYVRLDFKDREKLMALVEKMLPQPTSVELLGGGPSAPKNRRTSYTPK